MGRRSWDLGHLRPHIQHLHAHFGTNSATVAMLVGELIGLPYSFTVHGPEEFDKAEAVLEAYKHATEVERTGAVMFGTETGSEVMKRIATPMVGGLVSSTLLTLVVIPAIYAIVKGFQLRGTFRVGGDGASAEAEAPDARGWIATGSRYMKPAGGAATMSHVCLARSNM